MPTSRVWPFIVVILLFCAASVVTGENPTQPGVALQFAPVLDDSELNKSLSSKELQHLRDNDPGDKSVTTDSRSLQAVSRESRALLSPDPGFVGEVEPNGTSATATPLGGTSVRVQANIVPNADVDWYSFTAAAGDRVYAAVMTSFSANGSTDSQLRLFQSDGTTLIEFDDNDGTLGGSSSTIANATLPSAGTYFLEVRHFSAISHSDPTSYMSVYRAARRRPRLKPTTHPRPRTLFRATAG